MIVITGINGLLGSSLVQQCLTQGISFTGIDRGPCANDYLGSYPYEALDLTDGAGAEALLNRLKPHAIIHGAAMTAVDVCESERALAWDINVNATATLARWSQAHGARFIYVSTDYVFDGLGGAPYSEEAAIKPLGVYAQTKAAGELAVQTLCKNHVIARTSVPFGAIKHVKKDFVRWLLGELNAQKPVRIVTDQLSNPTFAEDSAQMMLDLVAMSTTGIVNTAGGTGLSRYDFAKLCAVIFEQESSLITPITTAELTQAAPRPLDARLDMTHAQTLGLKVHSLHAALTRLKAKL